MQEDSRKVAVITGASRGIGKAAVLEFTRNDWFVIMLDIFESDYDRVAEEIGPKNCCFISCDVSNAEDMQEIFKGISQISNGRLDLLVNNAGVIEVGEFDDLSLSGQNRIVDVNLKGVINCTYHALPLLKKTRGSQIINLCSASALIGNPELTVYAATKSAVKSLTEGWAIGFEKYGIKVSDLLPMKVKTAMVTDYIDNYKDRDESRIKLTPEYIAQQIYRATKRYRIHHYQGRETAIFAFLTGILPYKIQFWLLKKVIKYN